MSRITRSRRSAAEIRHLMGSGLALCTLLALIALAGCPRPSTPDRTPPGPVSNLTATPGDGQAILQWTNPAATDLAGVRIQRATGSAPTEPTGGSTVFQGMASSHTDTALENDTDYFYAVFAFDTANNFSNATTVSVRPSATPDTTPPGPVTGFEAQAGDAQVSLAWVNPGDADFAAVKIQRSAEDFPATPTDGTTIFEGASTEHTDTTAENGTTYFYTAFARDTAGNYSAGAQATATPTSEVAQGEVVELYTGLGERIREVPEDILPVDVVEILIGLLEDSETLYRRGEVCAAGEALFPLMDSLQDLREGEATALVEDFYNDSRMLRFDMLMAYEEKAICAGTERLGIETRAEPEEESNLLLRAGGVFSEPIVRTMVMEHDLRGTLVAETFTQVDIPGADADLGEPGKPAVPIYRTLVAAPRGAAVRLVVDQKDFQVAETVKMNLLPTQEQPVDQDPFDPEFADKPFTLDVAAYESNDAYPPQVATIVSLGAARDMELYLLEVATGQYFPASDTLQLFRNARATVNFEGGSGNFLTSQSLSPFESTTPLFANAVLNKNVIFEHVEQLTINPNLLGEELLLLYHPTFEAEALAFRDHKRSIGIATNAFACGTGSGMTGRQTAAEIRAFILSRYNSTLIRPSYILLLGDAEFIPPWYLDGIGTDWPYSILGTVGVDKSPDFGVGRIPVDTAAQAQAVLNKIIAYEKNPPLSASFYANAAIAAQFQCCRTGATNPGTDQRTFIQVSEFARNVMTNAGKTVQRIYMRTVDPAYGGDPTPRRYYNGTFLPAALSPGSGFAWTGNTTQIINAWNAGRFLIMHRDHGWHGGWADPLFDSGHIDSLTNGSLLPVVFSVNCASGLFDNETAGGDYGTTVSGVYWAEKLLRKPNGGAVGILGDTRNSPSWANSTLTQGFFDSIWPNALPAFGSGASKRRLGDILNHGKLYLMSKAGFEVMGAVISNASATEELYLWHVLGDPTMKLRTASPLNFVLPAEILFEISRTTLRVDYPQDGAEITVFQTLPGDGSVQPVARAVVQNGEAIMPLIDRNPDAQLLFVAEGDDAVPVELEATPINP